MSKLLYQFDEDHRLIQCDFSEYKRTYYQVRVNGYLPGETTWNTQESWDDNRAVNGFIVIERLLNELTRIQNLSKDSTIVS